MNIPKIYGVQEFADIIGHKRQYVWDMARKGILKPDRTITGKPYYTDEHIKKYFGLKG